MPSLARWAFRHRRIVLVLWILAVVGLGVGSNVAGDAFDDDFNLPNTESTQALELIKQEFPQASGAASGEAAQIVVHANKGQLSDPAIRDQISAMLEQVRGLEHVREVTSFYSPEGAQQISPDQRTGFASVSFAEPAPEIPTPAIQKVIDTARAVNTPDLQVDLGGQVITV